MILRSLSSLLAVARRRFGVVPAMGHSMEVESSEDTLEDAKQYIITLLVL